MADPTLREYLVLQILGEQALRVQAQEAHASVHTQEAEARERAATQLQEYKEHANEFRGQLVDERTHFVQREYYDTQHGALREEVRRMGERISRTEQTIANYDGRLMMLALGLTVLSLLIAIAPHLWKF